MKSWFGGGKGCHEKIVGNFTIRRNGHSIKIRQLTKG